jgi:hypothetical protein
MSARESAVSNLLSLVAAAYPWAMAPSRRLRLWSDVPAADRPACFLFEGGFETYADGAAAVSKRSLAVKLFIYVDARDATTTGASALNAIMDALDEALTPRGADAALGRVTLNGAAYRCSIVGKPLKDPGDLDGDGLLIVPVEIVLP